MTKQKNIKCDGDLIVSLRIKQAMTQEKLAIMSNVDTRTIQRAEQSKSVQLDTLASIAATLKVTVQQIAVQKTTKNDQEFLDSEDNNAVVLRPINSGKTLIDMLHGAYSGDLICEAEPTTENIDLLSSMVEEIENLIPNPWEIPMNNVSLSLAERLRKSVSLTTQLTELGQVTIGVFAGVYTAKAQVPRYDMDEGCMYSRVGQAYEPVTVCRIVIASLTTEKITMTVNDKWEESRRVAQEDFDDIPF